VPVAVFPNTSGTIAKYPHRLFYFESISFIFINYTVADKYEDMSPYLLILNILKCSDTHIEL
jgi:hypothetical protein